MQKISSPELFLIFEKKRRMSKNNRSLRQEDDSVAQSQRIQHLKGDAEDLIP